MSTLELLVLKVAFHLLRVAWRDSLKQSSEAARIRAHATELMAGREPLTSEGFAVAFFPPSERSVAAKIHRLLGELLIVEATRVQADDNLFKDLGVEQLHALDLSYINAYVHREWGVRIGAAWERLRTVRDLVRYVCENHSRGIGVRS